MRVFVVGGGGREHALAWKLAQNATVDKLFCAPGNAGITQIAECFEVAPDDSETLGNLAEDLGIDMVVVGPEAPLVAGLADDLETRGLAVFGPSAAGARIEGSKAWMKEVCAAAGVPTARARTFTDARAATGYLDELSAPYVVKADGLAAGKGVTIAETRADAEAAIGAALDERVFGDAGATLVIEEFLEGEEISMFALSDGADVLMLEAAQDHKRIGDGDTGPNTGGMGAYSPVKHLDAQIARAKDEIFVPVVQEMARRGARYRGALFAGLMVTRDGLKVLEFNCRFGDPETQALIPRLQGDLAEMLLACCEGNIGHYKARWTSDACVTVVLASRGYPGDYQKGKKVTGLDAADGREGVVVFHAGTARDGDDVVTAGGRVLAVSALGASIAEARDRAYDAAALIDFDGKYHRNDIGVKAI